MTRSVLTFVMFATVSASTMTQSPARDTVHEPRSGTPFPFSLTPPGGTTPHWIMGTAVRQRTLESRDVAVESRIELTASKQEPSKSLN